MTKTFEDLGVDRVLVDILAGDGVREPFPIQALTIADALAGRDVCGKAKTGSGKTLAFGLPLLMLTPKAGPKRPTSLVMVPTRELALQVFEVLEPLAKKLGLRIETFYGGTPIERQLKVLSDGVDVVVATPGRLIDLTERKAVEFDAVAICVLDEADRMADMGFLPQVEWIMRRMTQPHQTLLFSATLDSAVNHLVKHYQNDPVFYEVESKGVTVEQMTHRFLGVHQMDKAKVAAAISRGQSRTLIFSRTKRGADRLVADLRADGVNAAAIHGDLRQQMRERALADFTSGKLPVLVATDVAARGLHVEEIDVVIHYDPPEDHKAYLHRSGRTARAGRAGVAVTLVLWNQHMDIEKLQKRIGIKQPIAEVFSNDKRLADLIAWDPAAGQPA